MTRESALIDNTKSSQAQCLHKDDFAARCASSKSREFSNAFPNPRSYSTGGVIMPSSLSQRIQASKQKWHSERSIGGSPSRLDDQKMSSFSSPRKPTRSESFEVEQIIPKRSPSGVNEFPSQTSLEQQISAGSKKLNISNHDRSVLQQLSCLDQIDGDDELSEGDTFGNGNALPEDDTITTPSSELDQTFAPVIDLPKCNKVPSQVTCTPADSSPTKPVRRSSRRQLLSGEPTFSLLSLTSLDSIPSNKSSRQNSSSWAQQHSSATCMSVDFSPLKPTRQRSTGTRALQAVHRRSSSHMSTDSLPLKPTRQRSIRCLRSSDDLHRMVSSLAGKLDSKDVVRLQSATQLPYRSTSGRILSRLKTLTRQDSIDEEIVVEDEEAVCTHS